MNPQHKNSTLDMFPLTLDALTLRLDRFFFNGTDVFTVGGGGGVCFRPWVEFKHKNI